MPFIQIIVPTKLDEDTKTTLVQQVIDRTHQAVGSDPAIINVVIHELPVANVSVGGTVHHGRGLS